MPLVTTADAVRTILVRTRTIAVLGAHNAPERPAFYVADYLHRMGYRVLPVNAMLAGTTLWGEPVRSRLSEVPVAIDLVDIFRRSDAIPDHLEEILALSPLPRVVWMQSGIRHAAVAESLSAAGIDVVQDRCTFADHRAFGIGPVPPDQRGRLPRE